MADNLYNKYRILNINDLIGQDSIVKDLKRRFKENSVPHSILLTGPTGTGKTSLEYIIAKHLLCNNKNALGNPCDVCDICTTVVNEKPSNYFYMMNASNIGINEMREIESLAMQKSLSSAKAKVIVIDEMQELGRNQQAAKNILKVLERPSSYSYFILGGMDESKINTAIKNRCTPYKLKFLSADAIAERLHHICKNENIAIDTEDKADVLFAIADNSFGSMRSAISYLERVIYSDIWDKNELLKELNLVSNVELSSIINRLFIGDYTILENEIDNELMNRIRFVLNLYLKSVVKVELSSWQISQIKGIKITNLSDVFFFIDKMNDFYKFNYVDKITIETTLIFCMNKFKQNATTLTKLTEEKRRREPKS